MSTTRLEVAARVLAGFAANPAVFASNENCGWSLVNATADDIAGYALSLADKLIAGEKIAEQRASYALALQRGEAKPNPEKP